MATAVAALLVGSFGLAAALAPLVFRVVTATVAPGMPFSRAFDRTALVMAVVLLWLLRRRISLARVVQAWRGRRLAGVTRSAALGFVLSAAPAVAVLAVAVPASGLPWAGRTTGAALGVALASLLPALLIGLVEESFFRAVVFQGLATEFPLAVAVPLASTFYAVIHFLQPPAGFVPTLSAFEGFRYLQLVAARPLSPDLFPAVLGLVLVGATLCLTLRRGDSLSLCIGLHAGWIVAFKVAILLTSLPPRLSGGGSMAKRSLLLGCPWIWLAVGGTAAVALLAAPAVTRLERRQSPGF